MIENRKMVGRYSEDLSVDRKYLGAYKTGSNNGKPNEMAHSITSVINKKFGYVRLNIKDADHSQRSKVSG